MCVCVCVCVCTRTRASACSLADALAQVSLPLVPQPWGQNYRQSGYFNCPEVRGDNLNQDYGSGHTKNETNMRDKNDQDLVSVYL